MLNTTQSISRLLSLAAFASVLLLSACGGGGGSSSSVISDFNADKANYYVGEHAQLYVAYSQGEGRIEPSIGAVSSGATIETPILDTSTTYRLIIEANGSVIDTRDLMLKVRYRDRWQTLGTTLSAAWHQAVSTADGSVLIIGGDRGQTTLSADIHRFDPQTQLFTRFGTLSSGRANFTATRLSSGHILVTGGETNLTGSPDTELVDEVTGAVIATSNLNQKRIGHAAVLLSDGRVLVVGGSRDTLEIWDPDSNLWKLLDTHMAHARQNPTATLLRDGRVLIAGGIGGSSNYTFAEIFDPADESMSPVTPNLTQRRSMHTAHRQADGSVLIIGGEIFDSVFVPLSTVLRFDPDTASFTETGPLNLGRSLIPAVSLPNDQIFLAGGQHESPGATAFTSFYASSGEHIVTAMPDARIAHSASRLPDGRLLVVGGQSEIGQLRSAVYVYD